jgi:hypothetical protein
LRQADGKEIDERQSLAIFEALQAAGMVGLDADNEGNYPILPLKGVPSDEQRPKPEEEPSHDRQKTARGLGGLIIRSMQTTSRVADENKRNAKHHFDTYIKKPVAASKDWVEADRTKNRRAVSEEQARHAADRAKFDNWNANERQTRLVFRQPKVETTETQLGPGESIEAQFDQSKMQEYRYLIREISQAVNEEIHNWKDTHGQRITRRELAEVTRNLNDKIIREFYDDEDLTDDEVARRGAILTFIETNIIGVPQQQRQRRR